MRHNPSLSPKKKTESSEIINGAVKKIAVASHKPKNARPEKKHTIANVIMHPRRSIKHQVLRLCPAKLRHVDRKKIRKLRMRPARMIMTCERDTSLFVSFIAASFSGIKPIAMVTVTNAITGLLNANFIVRIWQD